MKEEDRRKDWADSEDKTGGETKVESEVFFFQKRGSESKWFSLGVIPNGGKSRWW